MTVSDGPIGIRGTGAWAGGLAAAARRGLVPESVIDEKVDPRRAVACLHHDPAVVEAIGVAQPEIPNEIAIPLSRAETPLSPLADRKRNP